MGMNSGLPFHAPEPTEAFHWGPCVWDITHAKKIIGNREANSAVDVDGWMKIAGLINLDPDHVQYTDPSNPPILAFVPGGSGQADSVMLIDGWHRVAKAKQMGMHTIPGHLLSPEESAACRLDNFKPKGIMRRRRQKR